MLSEKLNRDTGVVCWTSLLRLGFCAWLQDGCGQRICFGGDHARFMERADGCQSGDRLAADDIAGWVREHEPAVLFIIPFGTGARRPCARNAGNDTRR